jgi:hypothetical protein
MPSSIFDIRWVLGASSTSAKIFLQYDNKMYGSRIRCRRMSSFAKCENYKLNLKLDELYIGEHKLDPVSCVTVLVPTQPGYSWTS